MEWHITLGRWLKDYIYFPLVMSKFSMKISRILQLNSVLMR